MTDDQFNQLFNLLTELLNAIERIEEGQIIEKPIRQNNAPVDYLADEQICLRNAGNDTEKPMV